MTETQNAEEIAAHFYDNPDVLDALNLCVILLLTRVDETQRGRTWLGA